MKNKMIDELKLAINPAVTLCQACRSVWQFILGKAENDRADYLKAFLTGFKSAGDMTEKPSENFFDVEWKSKQDEAELTDLENRIVSNLVGSSMEEPAFYAALCTKLSDDTLLSTPEDKAIFLALLWMDPRIPYYKLDKGLIMSNEAYRSIINKIQESINKAIFILNVRLDYKTQRSSLLLDVANALESDDERVVFWAVLLDILYKRRSEMQRSDELRSDEDATRSE